MRHKSVLVNYLYGAAYAVLPIRCDGSQQYPRKLSTKKSQDFLLIVSARRIIFLFD
jgi:hypothetical protein